MSTLLETHTSPDGALTLLVFARDDEREVRLVNSLWSMDSETLRRLAPGDAHTVTAKFVLDILADVLPIAITADGDRLVRMEVVSDLWWTGKFDSDEYLSDQADWLNGGENVSLRLWSSPTPLIGMQQRLAT